MSTNEKPQQVRITDARRLRALLLSLDGLRYACGICAVCYQRATAILRTFENTANDRMEVPEGDAMLVVADIWAIVDSVHRARVIAARTPYLRRASREYDIFERNTRPVEAMRNYIQHLDSKILELGDESTPVWGSISWQSASDARTAFTLMPANALFKQSHFSLIYDTFEHKFVRPIELVVGAQMLDVDGVVRSVGRLSDFLRVWTGTFKFENGSRYSYDPKTVSLIKTRVAPIKSGAPMTKADSEK